MDPRNKRVTLDELRQARAAGEPFAMLTAYDHPTAVALQAAGVPVVLVGDSMGSVVLGQESTRGVPLELMLVLGEAVRRGAPGVYLVGDLPFEAVASGPAGVRDAARRFRQQAGCDAVKLETRREDHALVRMLADDGHQVIAHLGLRPQWVESRDQLRAQAREEEQVRELAADCVRMVEAGAVMILLEAVPNEAAEAVVATVDVPVIGCGAGAACHGHVVVTHDLLGLTPGKPPRFVPVLERFHERMHDAFARYAHDIRQRTYPGPQHVYGMRKSAAAAP